MFILQEMLFYVVNALENLCEKNKNIKILEVSKYEIISQDMENKFVVSLQMFDGENPNIEIRTYHEDYPDVVEVDKFMWRGPTKTKWLVYTIEEHFDKLTSKLGV